MPESIIDLVFSIFLFGIVLFLLYKFVKKLELRKYRALAPFLAMVAIAIVGNLIGEYVYSNPLGLILMLPVPTLAILTCLPFVEPSVSLTRRGPAVAVVTLVSTIIILLYKLLWKLTGFSTIFLPSLPVLPVSGLLFRILEILTFYIEMIIVVGVVVGAVSFVGVIAPCSGWEDMQIFAVVFVLVVSFVIGSFLVGFFAVFLLLALREFRSTSLRVTIPAVAAVVLSLLISSLPAATTLPMRNPLIELYDLTLYALALLAFSAITLYPLFERHFDRRDGIVVVCACSTVAALVLSIVVILANGVPAIGSVNVLSAPAVIESSTVFAIGAPFHEGLANKLILYGSGVLVSSIGYGIVILTNRRKSHVRPGSHENS